MAATLVTSLVVSGTKSFRLASRKLLGVYGINAQNPSQSLMRCIIPPPNYIFCQPDQSGAEALIVAYEAPRGKFRRLFELGLKVHSYLALQLFLNQFVTDVSRFKFVDPDKLYEYPECKELFKKIKNSGKPYDLGKRVIHARNFKMGPRTFQINVLEMSEGKIVLSFKESKDFLGLHETLFPEIVEWQNDVKEQIAHTRTLRNLFGYPRQFNAVWTESMIREACSFVPQSTVATITNLAYVETYNYIKQKRLPWKLLNNKHDSLLTAVPDTTEHKEHARHFLKKAIEKELVSSRGEHFQMKSGISWGYNWGKYDETDNPEGMKEE